MRWIFRADRRIGRDCPFRNRTCMLPSPPMSERAKPTRPGDAISEGARARSTGRPKDACPYPPDSTERIEWLESYDGTPSDHGPDLPMDNG